METNLFCCTGFGNGQAYTQHSIGTELRLVWRPVKINQELVNSFLIFHIKVLLNHSRAKCLVDVFHGLEDTLAAPLGFVSVSKFMSFMLTWGFA